MTQIGTAPAEIARINAKLNVGDVDGAVDLAREAYISGVVDPLVLNLVAHRLEERGEIEEALKLLHEALELSPQDESIYANIGHCLLKLARPTHALEAFNRALKIDKNYPRAHHGAGLALTAMGHGPAGEDAQLRAVRLDPKYPAPRGTLALGAYEKRDFQRAETLSAETLRLDPSEPSALIVKASLHWERGEAEECAELTGHVLKSIPLAPLHRAAFERQYADALDRLGRFDEAFAGYEAANSLLRQIYEDRFDAPDVVSMTQVCGRLIEYFGDFEETKEQRPDSFAKNGVREHVFLLGFPRSGTTLLEQVLASHPDIDALEEMPTLEGSIQRYFFQTGDPDELMQASEEDLEDWRGRYWAKVKEFGIEAEGRVFIDKQPSLTMYIPLIRRLFPRAKILFCIRDPRDVVLGCFRRTFRMNATIFEYTSISSLAEFYAETMSLAEVYASKLELSIYRHIHENLVADFDGEVANLCDFLGVGFTPEMRDFVATAQRRDVRTPSAKQIRLGLNASGVGYWTHYRRHLEGILPILEPWALKFGYESAFPQSDLIA